MYLFNDFGFADGFRVAHVLAVVMWMGLLWFFNFVQVPAYAELDAGARNQALDKLTWRALWWFRWAALATVVFGLFIILSFTDLYMDMDFWKSTSGLGLFLAIVMGFVMFANVWGVIWPNQQIVIGNARNVLAGGEANPDAPAAGRKALMASRQNLIFSFPVLFLMLSTGHIFSDTRYFEADPGGTGSIYALLGLVIIAVLEVNSLGKLSGTGNGGLNVLYETHKNAMYAGFVLIGYFYLGAELILAS